MPALPLVVFSHLRWDFVYQRPQHLLSRFARTRPVYFIEEPFYAPGAAPYLHLHRPAPGVTVCQPHTPLPDGGFSDAQAASLAPLLARLAAEHPIESAVCWLYTPLALPLARLLRPRALVYDCMDELAQFDFAPPELIEREKILLDEADLVFTGGPSLYRAKKARRPDAHCFSSSVDAAHFGRASAPLAAPTDQAAIPGPRLGFFGVVDERMDLDLVRHAAAARPRWQFVMVGPVVKIDPAHLPLAPNLHWLGPKSYADLPAYLAGWDVCLLPFARNRATEFISPTKTLEYMAAEKPIVSTPIRDVAEPYENVVYLGNTPEEFVEACEKALGESEATRARRVAAMQRVLAHTSWDATAARMAALLDAVLHPRALPEAQAVWAG